MKRIQWPPTSEFATCALWPMLDICQNLLFPNDMSNCSGTAGTKLCVFRANSSYREKTPSYIKKDDVLLSSRPDQSHC